MNDIESLIEKIIQKYFPEHLKTLPILFNKYATRKHIILLFFVKRHNIELREFIEKDITWYITEIIKRYDPDRISELPALLSNYKELEEDLLNTLCRRYQASTNDLLLPLYIEPNLINEYTPPQIFDFTEEKNIQILKKESSLHKFPKILNKILIITAIICTTIVSIFIINKFFSNKSQKRITNIDTLKISIGSKYSGGIVYYLDNSGKHGYVCAEYDQSAQSNWFNAIRVCEGLSLNGYTGWYLPDTSQALLMYRNLHDAGLGNFTNETYWCSNEAVINNRAWRISFKTGFGYYGNKNDLRHVRAIKPF